MAKDEFKPQPNGYTDQAPSLNEKGLNAIGLPIEKKISNLAYDGDSSVLTAGSIRSKDFKFGVSGWRLNADGNVELNKTTLKTNQGLTETNFRKMITEGTTGISIWVSDGTSPNSALTGVEGDICLNGSATGQLFYCDTDGKNWTVV